MAHGRGNVSDFEGGEIAQSIDSPRVCPRAGSPRSQEVDGPNLHFVRNLVVDCHLKVAHNSNHLRPMPGPA